MMRRAAGHGAVGIVAGALLVAVAVHGLGTVELNRQAIDLAQRGDLDGALSTLSMALAEAPTDDQLLNNMGVTLMRMGRYDQALDMLDRAIAIRPDHPDAVSNRRDLLHFMQRPSENAVAAPTLTPRLRLPRVALDDLYAPGNEDYAYGRKAFILTGATDRWPLFDQRQATRDDDDDDRHWLISFVRDAFPNSTADFYPHNMARSTVRPFLVPLQDAVDELRAPSGRFPADPTRPGSYVQWNIPLAEWRQLRPMMHRMPYAFAADEQWLDDCLRGDDALVDRFSLRLHWRMLLIGTQGAGMFFHHDVLRGSSWQVQIAGSKRWTICDPAANDGLLYAAGDVDTFRPDLARWPRFAASTCYDDVVRPGEMLFYPRDYWHQTLNLETPTITLTGTVVDENNADTVERELRDECTTGKWGWHLGDDLCGQLEQCYALWNATMTGDRRASVVRKCPNVQLGGA
ncbi:hypothetical protein PBRA_000291 [Plasmodiophora brassicae]|uniref:JmjC domain-containing protein n=1 Tax=Plasmodiophora brassicae TaxID=37360 RepID=A0A0G4IH14_PLABS|nr:hypothetical protein PBRA_000291 [Plasmodiophora brassicae]